MLFYGRDGQAHLLRYLPERFLVQAPEDEGAAALCRQRLDQTVKLAQFAARAELRLKIMVGTKQVQLDHRHERHDPFAPGEIDYEVARDREHHQDGQPERVVDGLVGVMVDRLRKGTGRLVSLYNDVSNAAQSPLQCTSTLRSPISSSRIPLAFVRSWIQDACCRP